MCPIDCELRAQHDLVAAWQVELLDHDANYPILSMAANTITVFNSCSNPVIYALRTEAFKRLMLRWFNKEDREIDVPD